MTYDGGRNWWDIAVKPDVNGDIDRRLSHPTAITDTNANKLISPNNRRTIFTVNSPSARVEGGIRPSVGNRIAPLMGIRPMIRILGTVLVAWCVCGGQAVWAQVKLANKFTPNTKSRSVENTSTQQTLTIAGMNVETSSDSKITAQTEFLTPADKLAPVKITIQAITLNANINGQALTFDSARPNEKAGNPAFEPALAAMRAMLDAELTYQVGADGKVARIDGIQAIISKAPADTAKALEERLNEDRLKNEFNQQAQTLPDTPVNVGDTWKRTTEMPLDGGQKLTFDRVYEYAGTIEEDGRKLDQIKIKDEAVRYAIGPNAANLAAKDSELKIESSEGTMLFDRELGATLERKLVSHITGKLTLQINGMDLPAELDLKITKTGERLK
ncbi:MAG: DUF6263 family protein [Pirellulales bacterium]